MPFPTLAFSTNRTILEQARFRETKERQKEMPNSKATEKKLTDLEAAVLGVIWRDGPCTPYAIRQHFQGSPSPRWSGSAGAIYPLVRRLEQKQLVTSAPGKRGKRAQRDYRISRDGARIFRKWLRNPDTSTDLALVHDPLRTRILFLSALTSEQSREFVERSLIDLQHQASKIKKELKQLSDADDRCRYLGARNAMLLTKARIQWLEEVLGTI